MPVTVELKSQVVNASKENITELERLDKVNWNSHPGGTIGGSISSTMSA